MSRLVVTRVEESGLADEGATVLVAVELERDADDATAGAGAAGGGAGAGVGAGAGDGDAVTEDGDAGAGAAVDAEAAVVAETGVGDEVEPKDIPHCRARPSISFCSFESTGSTQLAQISIAAGPAVLRRVHSQSALAQKRKSATVVH